MRRTLFVVIAVLVVIAASVTVINAGATDTETVAASYSETTEATIETEGTGVLPNLDSETTAEIIEIVENSPSKEYAIISIAEKLGITTEEAEFILNTVIDIGDDYFGETDWWVGFKKDVQEDIQFWATSIVLVFAVTAIAGGVFVLVGKTNPMMKKAMWGMNEALSISQKTSDANSQTLGELKSLFAEAIEREAAFEKIIDDKESQISVLTEKIFDLEEKNETEKLNMVCAEIYSLRMLKLALDRTAMPLQDKATIDLFYNKGVEALTSNLSAEDVEKIEKTLSTLDTVGEGYDA